MCFVEVGVSSDWDCSWADACSSGRIRALSCVSPVRRGRVDRSRVLASKRWLQKRQCCVRIFRRSVILR